MLSLPCICSRCGCVKGMCDAISSLLGHETTKRGEKLKRESSPWVKSKKKTRPKKKKDSIEETKKTQLAASDNG